MGEMKVQQAVIERAAKNGTLTELKRAAQSLDSQLISSLNSMRVFQLVERKRKGDIELEQAFAVVAVDPNDKNAAQAGKMAGAKYAFLPQIDGFDDIVATYNQPAIGRVAYDRKLFLSVVVQVVDTTTGKLLSESPSVQLSKMNVDSGDQAVLILVKEVAQKLSQELVAQLRPAKVLSLNGNQIMINRGSEAGFSLGDLLDIFAIQSVKDEDSGEDFNNEFQVGQATIVRIDKKQSFAALIGDNFGVAKGCLVKVHQTNQSNVPPEVHDYDYHDTLGSSSKPQKW
jgi:hypothetical protein